jgi:hypothetical protein
LSQCLAKGKYNEVKKRKEDCGWRSEIELFERIAERIRSKFVE